MNAKRIRTIVCVAVIATMLFSSMGIGAFAAVEQGVPQGEVQAQGTGDAADADADGAQQEPADPTIGAKAEGNQTISPDEVTIEVDKTETLTANGFTGDVEWSSSDESVATVAQDPEDKYIAVVTGKAAGPAVITVADKADPENINATCTVTVKEPEPAKPTYTFNSGVTTIRTVSGHQRIKVVWSPVKATKTQDGTTTKVEANRYIVQRAPGGGSYSDYCVVNVNNSGSITAGGNAVNTAYTTSPYWTKEPAAVGRAGNELYMEDKDVGDGLMDTATKRFRGGDWVYRVVPAYVDFDNGGAVTKCQPEKSTATAPDSCVRTSYVALKLKAGKNLTSHDKQHVKRSFKKGTTIYTCAFGYGRYQFIYNGNMYWLNRVGTRSHKSGYDKGHPYTDEEVKYYVDYHPSNWSATGKLVWVNTYTQRIFVFQGGSGNWSLLNSGGWYVSTGKAATPTIRYMDPKSPILDSGCIVGKSKTINKKVKSRHGIPNWNCFSTWNAIHGQKKSWSIKGIPKSNGCVRNTNAHAKYIYNNCPKKTRVLIF